MGLRPNVNIYANRHELSTALGVDVFRLAAKVSAEKRCFRVALSGGSLMDIIGPPLASHPLRDKIDWLSWHVFWVDERWVPWSSSDSNYGRAKSRFLRHVSIPDDQVHASDNTFNPAETASAYESTLATVFQPAAGRMPRFDLVLLGIGEDGHTASLFPNHPSLQETRRWVVPVVDAPKPPPVRISMTLPVINNARNVVVVASGRGKANILSKTLGPESTHSDLPIRHVHPSNGELRWFVDQAAVSSDP